MKTQKLEPSCFASGSVTYLEHALQLNIITISLFNLLRDSMTEHDITNYTYILEDMTCCVHIGTCKSMF